METFSSDFKFWGTWSNDTHDKERLVSAQGLSSSLVSPWLSLCLEWWLPLVSLCVPCFDTILCLSHHLSVDGVPPSSLPAVEPESCSWSSDLWLALQPGSPYPCVLPGWTGISLPVYCWISPEGVPVSTGFLPPAISGIHPKPCLDPLGVPPVSSLAFPTIAQTLDHLSVPLNGLLNDYCVIHSPKQALRTETWVRQRPLPLKSSKLRSCYNSFNSTHESVRNWKLLWMGSRRTRTAINGLEEAGRKVCDLRVT